MAVEPVAICDQFSFILMFYINCHISIFIFKVTICNLKRVVTGMNCKPRLFNISICSSKVLIILVYGIRVMDVYKQKQLTLSALF